MRYNRKKLYTLVQKKLQLLDIDVAILAVAYEIEMDRKKLDCSVPMQVIKNCSSWRNTSAPIIEEISAYCKQVGVISPFQEQ
jgi:hypothetical protein